MVKSKVIDYFKINCLNGLCERVIDEESEEEETVSDCQEEYDQPLGISVEAEVEK